MIDVSVVTERLPSVSGLGRARSTAVRWIPGLREDAPKRNFVLLIAYVELLLFGLSLLRHVL
ncbi:MAG: hypothetical protein V5A29_19525 [Haloarculaceae archaeon]